MKNGPLYLPSYKKGGEQLYNLTRSQSMFGALLVVRGRQLQPLVYAQKSTAQPIPSFESPEISALE